MTLHVGVYLPCTKSQYMQPNFCLAEVRGTHTDFYLSHAGLISSPLRKVCSVSAPIVLRILCNHGVYFKYPNENIGVGQLEICSSFIKQSLSRCSCVLRQNTFNTPATLAGTALTRRSAPPDRPISSMWTPISGANEVKIPAQMFLISLS